MLFSKTHYRSQLMLLGSFLWLRLLVRWLMGKSPPSIMSPDKLKRLVEMLLNHSGEFALQLNINPKHKFSRPKGLAMIQIYQIWQIE